MNRRQIAGLSVVGLAVVGALAFVMMNNKPSGGDMTAEPVSDIGIIDIKAAASHHPDYEKFKELHREINTLQDEFESMQLLQESEIERAADNPDKLAQAEQNMAVQNNMMMETTAQKEVQQKRRELHQAAAAEMAAAVEEVNDIYMTQIFNIQLKLDNLRLDDAVRQKYEADREALYAEREAAIDERKQAIDAKYMAQFDAYAADVMARAAARADEQHRQQADASAEHNAAVAQRNAAAAAASAERQKFDPLKLAANQEAIEAKEREAAQLEDKINSDIAAKAAKIAVERNLKAVIAPKQHVNIFAVDITDFVIAEFNS